MKIGKGALALAALLVFQGMSAQAKTGKASSGKSAATAPVHKADDPGCRTCVTTAASLFAQGKAAQAANMLQEWSGKCPNSSQVHLMLSTILIRTGDRSGAEKEAALAVEAAPTLVAAHLQYGLVLMSNEHWVQAKQEFTRVTELDPGSYEGWSSLAMLNKQLHDDAEAKVCADKAADLEPGTKAIRMATLLNLKRAGKFSQAKAEIKRMLSDTHASPEFTEDLAREAMLVGAFEEAAMACGRVSAAYPKATTPLLMAALAHYCAGDFAGCQGDAERMISLEPQNADGVAMKAMALARQNKVEEADVSLKELIATATPSSVVLLGKGTVDLAHGSFAESESALQNCLEADASNNALQGLPHTLAHLALKELYTKVGKASQAAEQARAVGADKRFMPATP